jgi:glucosylglycerate hydrolase
MTSLPASSTIVCLATLLLGGSLARSEALSPARARSLEREARDGLRRSTVEAAHGRFTKAAERQYPHQWSWDSAFVAMGLAHVDPRRAAEELTTLFRGQWRNGKVPHIVFDSRVPAEAYFPDASRWATGQPNPAGPRPGIETSGLINPPVHALAALEIWRAAEKRGPRARADARAALVDLYPKLLAWHRYLATARDPERSGLITIVHPWESGMDNSPRWDGPLSRVVVDRRSLPRYQRRDRAHADADSRPSDAAYERFVWLMESYKRLGYDDRKAYAEEGRHPFLVKDVFASALFVRANEALLELGAVVGAPRADRARIERWLARGRAGLEARWDPELGAMTDLDVLSGEALRVRTVASFAPLVAGKVSPARRRAQLELLDSRHFAGHPGLARPLPPSTSPSEPSYDPKNYWRGPVWPVVNWILWRALAENGAPARAEALRRDTLAQIAERGAAEYFDGHTEEPYGALTGGKPSQAWTHAFVLAALRASQPEGGER